MKQWGPRRDKGVVKGTGDPMGHSVRGKKRVKEHRKNWLNSQSYAASLNP